MEWPEPWDLPILAMGMTSPWDDLPNLAIGIMLLDLPSLAIGIMLLDLPSLAIGIMLLDRPSLAIGIIVWDDLLPILG